MRSRTDDQSGNFNSRSIPGKRGSWRKGSGSPVLGSGLTGVTPVPRCGVWGMGRDTSAQCSSAGQYPREQCGLNELVIGRDEHQINVHRRQSERSDLDGNGYAGRKAGFPVKMGYNRPSAVIGASRLAST